MMTLKITIIQLESFLLSYKKLKPGLVTFHDIHSKWNGPILKEVAKQKN